MSTHTMNAQVSEAFAEMQGLNSDRDMRVVEMAWRDLAWGMYLADTEGKVWQVTGRMNGWVRLLDIHGQEVSVPPKPLDHPVRAVVLPEDQAVLLLERCLGAHPLTPRENDDNFRVARQLLTAERWAVPLMPATGPKSALRRFQDHMAWFHASQYVGDIKTIEALAEVHEEMHASIGDMPMAFPHHHTANPKGRT